MLKLLCCGLLIYTTRVTASSLGVVNNKTAILILQTLQFKAKNLLAVPRDEFFLKSQKDGIVNRFQLSPQLFTRAEKERFV